jgi:hypothetical protein
MPVTGAGAVDLYHQACAGGLGAQHSFSRRGTADIAKADKQDVPGHVGFLE